MVRLATMGRARRVILALAATAAVVGTVVPAGAHANYKSSDPAHDSTVQEAPDQVTAEYSEPPTPNSEMLILDHCERRVDDGTTVIVGFTMSIGLTTDHPSRYTVHWQAKSARDGHRSIGSFWFTVAGRQAACPSEAAGSNGGSSDGEGNSDGGTGGVNSGGGGSAGAGTPRASSPGTPAKRPTPDAPAGPTAEPASPLEPDDGPEGSVFDDEPPTRTSSSAPPLLIGALLLAAIPLSLSLRPSR